MTHPTHRLHLCILCTALLASVLPNVAAWSQQQTTDTGFPVADVFVAGQDGYKVFRIPAIVRTADDDLLAFCEARQGGDASEIDLVMKRSTDAGKTWGPLQVIQESTDFRQYFGADAPAITIGNPAPVVDLLDPQHPGRIWLPFTLENDRVFVIFSDDAGATWSPRREITQDVKKDEWGWYATGPVHSIQIQQGPHRGRLVIPTDHRVGEDGKDGGDLGAHLILSDDHGKTWRLGAIDDTYQDGIGANETTVVELADGTLYVNTRDQGRETPGTRGETWSRDGGESFDSGDQDWQAFRPAPTVLDAPVVQCSLLRFSDDLIVFSGPDSDGPSGPGRSDLRFRYSTDQAESWNNGPLIHTGPAAYSDLVRVNDNTIGVLFENGDRSGKNAYQRISFARIERQKFDNQNNQSPLADWLRRQDRDGDGKIARDESSGLMQRFFSRNDTNQDGFLDRQELRRLAAQLARNRRGNRNGNNVRGGRPVASDEQLRSDLPDGVEVELNVAYRDGNEVWKLDLAKPKQASSTSRPAIVFVHGGGWRSGDKRAGNFIGPAIEYAKDGYVTVSVNYRLDREILLCVQDVKCAVRWLRAHADKYNIDPNRIGAYGNSAGAHLVTMLALSHTEPKLEGDGPWQDHSSRIQAVVASATPTLPMFGTGSEEVKRLVAPISYVSAEAPPILLFHDQSDRTVPIANADRFVDALKQAGAKDVTYKRYDNGSGHGVFGKNARETSPLMKAFFARTLGVPGESVAK